MYRYHAGIDIARNRPGWASDHAYRIGTVHAGLDELQAIMSRPLPDESRISVMSTGTRFNAIITSGATMQIDDHRLATVIETVLDDEFQQLGGFKLGSGGTELVVYIGFSRFVAAFASAALFTSFSKRNHCRLD
jgi:hypothetical protein